MASAAPAGAVGLTYASVKFIPSGPPTGADQPATIESFQAVTSGIPHMPSFWRMGRHTNTMKGATEPHVIHVSVRDALPYGDAINSMSYEDRTTAKVADEVALQARVGSTHNFFTVDRSRHTFTIGKVVRTIEEMPAWDGLHGDLDPAVPHAKPQSPLDFRVYQNSIRAITHFATLSMYAKLSELATTKPSGAAPERDGALEADDALAYYAHHPAIAVAMMLVFGGPGSVGQDVFYAMQVAHSTLDKAHNAYALPTKPSLRFAFEDSAYTPIEEALQGFGAYVKGHRIVHTSNTVFEDAQHARPSDGATQHNVVRHETYCAARPTIAIPFNRSDTHPNRNGLPFDPTTPAAQLTMKTYRTSPRLRSDLVIPLARNHIGLWPDTDGALLDTRGLHEPAIGPADPASRDIENFAGAIRYAQQNLATLTPKDKEAERGLRTAVLAVAQRLRPHVLCVLYPHLDLQYYTNTLTSSRATTDTASIAHARIHADPMACMQHYSEFHVRNVLIGLSSHGTGTVPVYLQTPSLFNTHAIVHLYLEDADENIGGVPGSLNTMLSDRLLPLAFIIANFIALCENDPNSRRWLIVHASKVPIPIGGTELSSDAWSQKHADADGEQETIKPQSAIMAMLNLLDHDLLDRAYSTKNTTHCRLRFDDAPCPWRRRRASKLHPAAGTDMYRQESPRPSGTMAHRRRDVELTSTAVRTDGAAALTSAATAAADHVEKKSRTLPDSVKVTMSPEEFAAFQRFKWGQEAKQAHAESPEIGAGQDDPSGAGWGAFAAAPAAAHGLAGAGNAGRMVHSRPTVPSVERKETVQATAARAANPARTPGPPAVPARVVQAAPAAVAAAPLDDVNSFTERLIACEASDEELKGALGPLRKAVATGDSIAAAVKEKLTEVGKALSKKKSHVNKNLKGADSTVLDQKFTAVKTATLGTIAVWNAEAKNAASVAGAADKAVIAWVSIRATINMHVRDTMETAAQGDARVQEYIAKGDSTSATQQQTKNAKIAKQAEAAEKKLGDQLTIAQIGLKRSTNACRARLNIKPNGEAMDLKATTLLGSRFAALEEDRATLKELDGEIAGAFTGAAGAAAMPVQLQREDGDG